MELDFWSHSDLYGHWNMKIVMYGKTSNNRRWMILSCGSHPMAYVECFDKKTVDEAENTIDVHGGITYTSIGSFHNRYFSIEDGMWIGWDYAHAGDAVLYRTAKGSYFDDDNDRKWQLREVLRDVERVNWQVDILEEKENVLASVGDTIAIDHLAVVLGYDCESPRFIAGASDEGTKEETQA